MKGTDDRLNPFLRALLFSLLFCLGIRIILPDMLDTPAALVILGVMPPLFACILTGRVLAGLSIGGKWSVSVIAVVSSILLPLTISPPPANLVSVIFAVTIILFFLEGRRSCARALAGLILAFLLFVPASGKRVEAPRLMIIGIDAMDYVVVNDLLKQGRIPHIHDLIERGAFGPFETEEPSISPIAWTTIATGRGPEVHGAGGFYDTSDQVRVPRIWDIMEENGYIIGLYRWLVTWPPDENVDGFWIPDILGRDDRTVPPEYAVINDFRDTVKGEMVSGEGGVAPGEIPRYAWPILGLGVRGSTLLSLGVTALGNLPDLLDDTVFRYLFMRRVEMEVNCDLFLRLLHRYRPGFAAFYDNGVDMVGHRYWSVEHPGWGASLADQTKDYSRAIPLIYGWTDRIIGRILDEIPPDANVALVSDHGQMALEGRTEDNWVILGDRLIQDLGLDDRVYVMTPGLFSLVFPVRSEGDEPAGDIVADELDRIRLAETGLPLLSVQIDTISSTPYLNLNPTHLTGEEEVLLDGKPALVTRYITNYYSKTGQHDRFGVIILSGPDVIAGSSIRDAGLRDLVPTLLYREGLPVAGDMDGTVLLDVLDTEREITYVDTYAWETVEDRRWEVDVDPGVKRKLKGLGYVN